MVWHLAMVCGRTKSVSRAKPHGSSVSFLSVHHLEMIAMKTTELLDVEKTHQHHPDIEEHYQFQQHQRILIMMSKYLSADHVDTDNQWYTEI